MLDEEQLDQHIAYMTRFLLSAAGAVVAVALVIWRIFSEFDRIGG